MNDGSQTWHYGLVARHWAENNTARRPRCRLRHRAPAHPLPAGRARCGRLALYSRIVAFDPLEQRLTRQMRGVLWRDGQLVAQEEYTLWENLYFYQEFREMLERAGL